VTTGDGSDDGGWPAWCRPDRVVLTGRYARLEPLATVHAGDLFAATDGRGELYDHLFEAPAAHVAEVAAWIDRVNADPGVEFWAVIDQATGRAEGRQALMRIEPAHGVIELGSILWGPAIARGRVATEAFRLMAEYVFDDLGYRRLEWKCNDLNGPSKRAAERFGFTSEGRFAQHMIVKGRSRDTAWFALLDRDWPARRASLDRWLDPANFDAQGRQRTGLARP
jgi:RimJ/RimL family protein N-acetyltransferase